VAHVRTLFGDRLQDVHAERRELRVDRFATGAQFRDFFARYYGPVIAAYRNVADDPVRTAELDAALAELGDDGLDGDGVMRWEYLVFTGTVPAGD
jgi:hypothetical protein